MPDQPTASPVPAPGQNLAAPGSLAQVLSDHPRWPHGPVVDVEADDVQRQVRGCLEKLGYFELIKIGHNRYHATFTGRLIDGLQVNTEGPGYAAAITLLTVWRLDGLSPRQQLELLLGGEE